MDRSLPRIEWEAIMALQLFKLPISHCRSSFAGISSSSRSLFFFPNSFNCRQIPRNLCRWDKAHMHLTVRGFAAAIKSGKVQLKKKKRLDEVCLERFEQYSRTFIQSWILQGKVFVDGKVVYKAGTPVSDVAVVEIRAEVPKYVCRGGYKLEAAIEQLNVDVAGKVALDSGLSTGGFTDCLLQYGASYVYGVDVGYAQVADKIRRDERVCVLERTNLRYLPGLPQKVDLVTLDLSFISILTVMPAVVNVMKEEATLITLVKPQFEARRSQVGKGGIVRDPLVHQEVREKIVHGVENYGFRCKGWIESPLKGAEGNTEFLVCFSRTADDITGKQATDETR
ncbi:16S rRNA (cytidine(1409)-2'-O)-methyltransferase [Bertholletia excelsa]